MIDFGPFKLGQPMLRGEDGFEHFATLEGQPVSVWKFPGGVADLPASIVQTLDLQRPLGFSSWVKLSRSGVEDGAAWVSGELVRGVALGRLLNSRRWANQQNFSQPLPLPPQIAVGIALAFARAVKDRGTLPLSEREFRASGVTTCQWRMRLQWDGTLRPMFDPAMFCAMPPAAGPIDFDLVTPELLRPGLLEHRAASDVFQVAAFLGLLLRDDGLFRSDPQQIAEQVTHPGPIPLDLLLPATEPKLREVLAAALVRDPTRRTPAVAKLVEQLLPFGEEEESRRWLSELLARHHDADRQHQERAFAELRGQPAEPIPPELEARVMGARQEEAAWLVLADWLNANGYARGELAMRHHKDRGRKMVKLDELSQREREALIQIDRLYWLYDLELYLHYGYVDAVVHVEEHTRSTRRRRSVAPDEGPPVEVPRFSDAVERSLFQALSLPSFRFLRAVLVDSDCPELDAVVRALAASRHPGVEEVFVPHERLVDVSAALRPRLPRLKRVRSCSECSEEQRRALLGYG